MCEIDLPMDLYPKHLAVWPRATLEREIRRRTQTSYLGNGVVLARVLGRHKMLLHGADRGFACHVMLDGYWEMWLTQFLAQTVTRGMSVIDVGANYGYYTLLMGDAVGKTGHVIAVEPNPGTAALLKETVLLNGFDERTMIVPYAVGAGPGTGLLYAPDGEPKNAQMVPHLDIPGGSTHQVQVTTIDTVALAHPKIDLVKIDAEGSEQGIVTGMQGVLARDRPILVLEWNAARYLDPTGFYDTMSSIYPSIQELTGEGVLRPVDRADIIDQGSRLDRMLVFR